MAIITNGVLWESTGLNGQSSVRKVRLDDGLVLQKIDIDREHFGEGMTLLNGEIFELTWKSQVGFVYGAADLKQKRVFGYQGEGWGLTNDGREIFMSDGTDEIRFGDPKTLARVAGWIDLRGLLPANERAAVDVLNGIAYDAQGKRLFVTGKLWPTLFEIQILQKYCADL